MSPRDLALYKDLGAVGQRLTGYPTISTFEEFTPDKSKPRYGSLKDDLRGDGDCQLLDGAVGSRD